MVEATNNITLLIKQVEQEVNDHYRQKGQSLAEEEQELRDELSALREKTPKREKKEKVLYGFRQEVIEEENVRQQIQQKRNELNLHGDKMINHQNLLQSKEEFTTTLSSSELNPIAIIPGEIWKGITRFLGLFRFEDLTSNNLTPARTPLDLGGTFVLSLISLLIAGSVYSVLPMLGVSSDLNLVISSIILFSGLFHVGHLSKGRASSLFLIACFPLCYLGSQVISYLPKFAERDSIGFGNVLVSTIGCAAIGLLLTLLAVKFLRAIYSFVYLCIVPRKRLPGILWPNYIDEDPEGKYPYIPIMFTPKPTKGFQVTMQNIISHKMRPHIAVTQEIIQVDRKWVLVGIRRVISNKIEEMISPFTELVSDPILYTKNNDGDLVAIHAQFGDYPLEKEAIDRVLNWLKTQGLKRL